MALGKQIGEFSLKSTSQTFGPGPGNTGTYQANMEGTLSGDRGEGTVSLTHYVEIEPNAKSGTYRHYGMVMLKDGTVLGIQGQGTWEETDPGKWRYRGTGQNSDGSTLGVEFEGDATTRPMTFTGKLYEWS